MVDHPLTEYNRGFADGFEAGRKSKILMISRGAYSDYTVLGSFDVMQSFTFNDVIEKFKAQLPDEDRDYPGSHDFIGWLVQHQYVQACSTEEVHIGDYGELHTSNEAGTKQFHPWAIDRLVGDKG